MSKIGTRDAKVIARHMRDGLDFKTHGSLKGGPAMGALTNWDMGRLPREHYTSAMLAAYIVWSYGTPIAWLDADGKWQIPEARYSVTTSRHQGTVSSALWWVRGIYDLAV